MLYKLMTTISSLPRQSLALMLVVLLCSTNASADRIDLSGLPDGDQGSGSIITPEGEFTTMDGGNWFKSAAPNGDFLCALKGASSGCGSWMLELLTAIDNLVFDVIGYNSGDSVAVSATDSAGATLTSFDHASAGAVSLLGFSDIKKVTVTDNSAPNSGGLGAGNFRFGTSSAVPAPGAMALLLLGLAGMRLVRRGQAV